MFSARICLLLVIVNLSCISLGSSQQIQYDQQSNWPEKCKNGRNQSPIALSTNSSKTRNFPDLIFKRYETPFPATLVNNGHTVSISLLTEPVDNKTPYITGGGLKGQYIFTGLHFHWSAEHVINKFRYPLEAHLVHYAKKYESLNRALNYSDGVAVLGVFYKPSKHVNHAFDELVENIPRIAQKFNSPINSTSAITLGRFLSDNQKSFFRYRGSLTTPNCNEAVIWTVFTKPSFISKEQYEVFTNMYAEPNKRLDKNYRYLQNRNNRQVYLSGG